jgi:hypothetical protein
MKSKITAVCKHCGTEIHLDGGIYLHEDGGEKCQPGFDLFVQTWAEPARP